MQNSMTTAHSTWEHLNQPKVFNSRNILNRDVPRRSCLDSFDFNRPNYRLYPIYLDDIQRAERSSSTSRNLPILNASPSSSYFSHSTAFQPLSTLPCPYTWPLLGGLSVPPDQIQRNQFAESPASQSAFKLESSAHRAQTSAASVDVQSVIAVDTGKEKHKTVSRRLSSSNSDCSFLESRRSNINKGSKPRSQRKPVEVKDARYWKKREKNNLAAKKSREAKQRQELSIQKKASLLEIENSRLQLELSCLRQENKKLKRLASVYM